MASSTLDSLPAEKTGPAQGALLSAGAGITGGYTGNSLSLKIIIAFFLGLSLYNVIELDILIFVTFQRYHGLYFWSLLISGFGVVLYALGFVIKFFQLLNPDTDICFVAVTMLVVGWIAMVSGQSVVLWSRLHLVCSSRRVLRWTLCMIIVNGALMHSITGVLTFGSNANHFSEGTLQNFVAGYSIMEKIQMTAFFIQEVIISSIYIRETFRILRLSESAVFDDVGSIAGSGSQAQVRNRAVRRLMYQLMTINVIIITMDIAILGLEYANLYLLQTTLKGAVYSIKLKLEFAVLGKLVQLVQYKNGSSSNQTGSGGSALPGNNASVGTSTGLTLEQTRSGGPGLPARTVSAPTGSSGVPLQQWPSFVDPRRVSGDLTHADAAHRLILGNQGWAWDTDGERNKEKWRKRTKTPRETWIEEEMDKHNIG